MCDLGYGRSGSTHALPYDHVTVDLQRDWNSSYTSKVTIPVTGYHFVDLYLGNEKQQQTEQVQMLKLGNSFFIVMQFIVPSYYHRLPIISC